MSAATRSRGPLAAAVKHAVPARHKQAARRAYLRVASVGCAGSRVQCSCCGRRLRRFARFHGLHDQCPGCGSLMRHRALMIYLREAHAAGALAGRVLHVAPERCIGSWLSSLSATEYVSVDLCSPLAAIRADLTALPFEDERFDLIVCAHVLEHVPDDHAAIAELFRVLRGGGTAVIQVPPDRSPRTVEDDAVTDPRERERLFGQYDHVRICGPDYRLRIQAAGFDVRALDVVTGIEPAERARLGVRAGEPFYIASRPAP